MATLIRWTIALGLVATPPAATSGASPAVVPWQPLIAEASLRFGVPTDWIERVILAESGGHTMLGGHAIRSRTGAIGLMQLMPATWADMRDAWHLGADPDDPHNNILAGTAYLRAMYDRFGYPGMFAAYNAGPARYASALATGVRLPAETLAYLATVTGTPRSVPEARRQAAMQTLFVVREAAGGSTLPPTIEAPADRLFAVRGDAAPGH